MFAQEGVYVKSFGSAPSYVGDSSRGDSNGYVLNRTHDMMDLYTGRVQHWPRLRYQTVPVETAGCSRKRPASEIVQEAGGKKLLLSREIAQRKTPRHEYLDTMFTNITLNKADRQASKRLVDVMLRTIMRAVTAQTDGGWMYSQQYINAGSYPVKMKIGKADEFDVNIPLNVVPRKVRLNGKISYDFDDPDQAQTQQLYKTRRLSYLPDGKSIPTGYAVIEAKIDPLFLIIGFRPTGNLPRKFLHEHIGAFHSNTLRAMTSGRYRLWGAQAVVRGSGSYTNSNRCAFSAGIIELIPWDVKKDLHDRLTTRRISMLTTDVYVSRECHGPALTLTIVPDSKSGIEHHINVDVTVSVRCDIPLTTFGWPREKTRIAFRHVDVNEAIQAGTHLVPKKDLFWAISFSKAERALLKSVDRDGGCRRYVTKLLKKYVKTCSSQSKNGLPGISSHIIKTQVLWSCEEHSADLNYWCWDNRDVCLIHTMGELETTLLSRDQREYFNPKLNIFEGKQISVLNELAEFMHRTRICLSNM